jgi:hypothetical protein
MSTNSLGRIRRGWLIVEMGCLIALIVLFNGFPDKIGILISATDPHSFYPLLAPGFQVHVPWLTLWWGLALCLAVIKFVYGRWTTALRWASLGLNILGMVVLGRLLLGGPILWSALLDGWPVPVLNAVVKVIIGLSLVGLFVRTARECLQLLAAKPAPVSGAETPTTSK